MHEDDANENVVASFFRSRVLSFVLYVQCKLTPKMSELVIKMMLKSIEIKVKILNGRWRVYCNVIKQ